MLFSFKIALQLNLKQLQTKGPPSQINNSSGKQVQIYGVVMSDCRDVSIPFSLWWGGIECAPRSPSVVHNPSIHSA